MQIKRQDLLEVLTLVKPGLARKDVIEGMTNVTFTGTDLITYNDLICITHPFQTDFKGSVSAEKLHRLLINNPSSETLEVSLNGTKLVILGDKLKATLPTSADTEVLQYHQRLFQETNEAKFKALPHDLVPAMELCQFSAGTDASNQAWISIYVAGNEVITSDGYRVSRYILSNPVDAFLIKAFVVPNLVGFNFTEYAVTEGWVTLLTENDVMFCIRRQMVEYPVDQFKKIITEFEDGVKFQLPDTVKEALEAVSVLSDDEKLSARKMALTIGNGELVCSVTREDGEVEKGIVLDEYKGEPIKVMTNPSFLYQILEKSTEINISKDLTRALFRQENFEHIFVLAMIK